LRLQIDLRDTLLDVQNVGRLLLPSEAAFLDAAAGTRRVLARSPIVQRAGRLGDRLRWLRAERSLGALAIATGISKARLDQLEKTELPNPSLAHLLRLQRAHGCGSLDELLGPLPSWGWMRVYLRELPGQQE